MKERCQRSSNCQMCWQSISLKDPSRFILASLCVRNCLKLWNGREALSLIVQEIPQYSIILPLGFSNYSIYQLVQMMQSLKSVLSSAGAAAMGRAHHHIARRDGPRSQSSVHGRPQFMVFSSLNSPPAYLAPVGGESEPATITVASLFHLLVGINHNCIGSSSILFKLINFPPHPLDLL